MLIQVIMYSAVVIFFRFFASLVIGLKTLFVCDFRRVSFPCLLQPFVACHYFGLFAIVFPTFSLWCGLPTTCPWTSRSPSILSIFGSFVECRNPVHFFILEQYIFFLYLEQILHALFIKYSQ